MQNQSSLSPSSFISAKKYCIRNQNEFHNDLKSMSVLIRAVDKPLHIKITKHDCRTMFIPHSKFINEVSILIYCCCLRYLPRRLLFHVAHCRVTRPSALLVGYTAGRIRRQGWKYQLRRNQAILNGTPNTTEHEQ